MSGAEYLWREAPVPACLEVRQVYGYLLCPRTGRVLVQDDRGTFNLPGGSPEPGDLGLAGTLVRESMEESQVRVGVTAYLGYQEVRVAGQVPFAQVRMAGVIDAFELRAPDPDGGRLFRRLMASLREAPGILGWGEPAVAQARAAGEVARRWGLRVDRPAPSGYQD